MIGLRLPPPGEEAELMLGLSVRRNVENGFLVVRCHYTADVHRRGNWKYTAAPKYGGLKGWRWRKEYEIDWEATHESLVFDNFEPRMHRVRPRRLPEHWPRWIFVDPGWRNPTSMLWIAVDIDTEPNEFGFRPVHVYREFYKARHTAGFCALVCHDWSAYSDAEGRPATEWIEAIVLDPMARQEHQGAQSGEEVPEVAETFISKFGEKIESLGWRVPVETGNNLKDAAIDEIISRLGNFWIGGDGVPLYEVDGSFRDATLDEVADGAYQVKPTLFLHAGCTSTIEEMGKYRFGDWADGDVAERHNLKERPLDKDDHSVTNIIRFVNMLRSLRGDEGSPDLSEFQPRARPRKRIDPDEMLRLMHERAAAGRRHHTGTR